MIQKKLNCWDYKECTECNTCPAFLENINANNGTNGGRICWSLESSCKIENPDKCINCNFYQHVKAEEGDNFKLILKDKCKNKNIIIEVDKLFNLNNISKFEDKIIKQIIKEKGINILFDFKKTEKMDSSSLGLLLVLRKYLGVHEANIKLINLNNHCRDVLKRANFNRLFLIEEF